MTESNQGSGPGRAARIVIGLCGLWILTGALFKLFLGTPNDLPPVVKDVPLALGTTYRLAIAVELVLAMLALLKPRWAWPLLVATFLVFLGVLTTQIAADAESCGCFGSKIQMSPWTMLAIDAALLVALLLTRPWRSLARPGSPLPLVAPLGLVLIAVPWLLDREVSTPPDAGNGGEVVANGAPIGPSWVQLDVASWVGMDLGETELGRRTDVYALPPDALWVLYRATCDHCARHLEALADSEIGQRFLVLCQLEEKQDTDENRLVGRMPAGDFVFHCSLPDTTEYVITTPAELEVEAFVVTRAEEAVAVDEY